MGSHHEVLEVLITKGGADVNVKNTKGQTPAMLASASGKLEILQMLYAAGADFRIATPQGFNVVHFAAQNGHTSLLSFFRNCHLSLDDIDKDGRTTLHWATYNGHRRAVEWLIEVGGVDVLCCDDEKCMPIHWAALQGNFRLAKVLLKHGDALKQLRAKECSGLTPYQLAVDKAGRVDRHKKMMFEKLSKNLKQLESEISRWHFMSKSLINWGCMGGVGGYGFWGLALFALRRLSRGRAPALDAPCGSSHRRPATASCAGAATAHCRSRSSEFRWCCCSWSVRKRVRRSAPTP